MTRASTLWRASAQGFLVRANPAAAMTALASLC